MTEAQAKRFDELVSDVKSIAREVNEISTDVAALSAKVDGSADRHGTEIAALFDARDNHERRLASVERDYTPRTEFAAVATRISSVETAQAKSLGMGVAINGLIQLIGIGGIAALIQWGGK